jgi:CelD/BcsL family acetyltransferase involved in cellulose biosynthesis
MDMLRYEVKRAAELTQAERATWRELLASSHATPSPCLTAEFFDVIAAVRPSARALVARSGSEPVAFLPHHRSLVGTGRPIGGPICDIHGTIAAPGSRLDAGEVLRAAGLASFSARHVPAGDAAFASCLTQRHAFHVIDLAHGFAAYESARASLAKSAFRAIRTRLAKAESGHGPVRCELDAGGNAGLAALLAWKAAQFRATGQLDVLAIGWVAQLIQKLLAAPRDRLRAQISTLHFGDHLAAVHLGLRAGPVLHYWFPAYDPALQELSPGNLLLYLMAKAAPGDGIAALHLGAGDYRYKHEFANCSIPIGELHALGPSLAGRAAAAGRGALDALDRALPGPLVGLRQGAARRLDRHLAFHAL